MSKPYFTTRRSFLGSMVILSAGATFGSVTSFFSPFAEDPGLETLWRVFYQGLEGTSLSFTLPNDKDAIPACKGHVHKPGTAIAFHKEGLIAQPTWVYWGGDQKKPADLIISFYDSQSRAKLFRLNRFELEGLQSLPAESRNQQLLLSLKETAGRKPLDQHRQPPSLVQTRIQKKGKEAAILTRFSGKELITQKNIIAYT